MNSLNQTNYVIHVLLIIEDEEKPDSKSIIDSKEYVHCYKCKLVILSSKWKNVV